MYITIGLIKYNFNLNIHNYFDNNLKTIFIINIKD